MSYHLNNIEPGVFGQASKIREEYEEFLDALNQGCKVMELVELSDLLGAIGGYVEARFSMQLSDLALFSSITNRAFETGHRKPKALKED